MSELIGHIGAAKNLNVEIIDRLKSTAPYWGFSIWGARRSGRSVFFNEISEHLNNNFNFPVNCFVGELEDATPEGFENVLFESIKKRGISSNDCPSLQGKIQTPDDFFIMCSELYAIEGKSPVFLIDMGKSLERSYDNRGMDGIIDLSRLLKTIYNRLKDNNINLVLGIGLTIQFVRKIESFAADVFVERYEPYMTLKNTSFEGDSPQESFCLIVKNISGFDIPEKYKGLWRGDIVVAGQYGENLKSSNLREITSQLLWDNLFGKWDIIGNTKLNIPSEILGDLILSDAVIDGNRFPEFLEACEVGYRANDKLYEYFGFFSPRRDPGITERIKRRIEDPDDNDVTGELLTSIGNIIKELGQNEINTIEILEQKCALMEITINKYISSESSKLENELYQGVFPRNLIIIVCLTSNPPEDILLDKIKIYYERNCFISVLFREGIDFGRLPIGRYIEDNIKTIYKHAISLEEIIHLLSNPDEYLKDTINNWIIDSIQNLFKKKTPLCVEHKTIKQLIVGTITTGILSTDKFAKQSKISTADINKCISLLTKPQILSKRKNTTVWDPGNDIILKILLESNGDTEKIKKEVSENYITNEVNINDLLLLYQCISGKEGLQGLTKERILEYTKKIQDFNLSEIKKYLDSEPDLESSFSNKYKAYSGRNLEELENVAPYLSDILNLLEDVKNTDSNIKLERDRNKEALIKKKGDIKQLLEDYSNYFTADERTSIFQAIENIRSLTSDTFIQTEKRIKRRKQLVDDANSRYEKFIIRLNVLNGFSKEKVFKETETLLKNIKELIKAFKLEEVETQIQTVDSYLIKLENLKVKQAILQGSSAPASGANEPGRTKVPTKPKEVYEKEGWKRTSSEGVTSEIGASKGVTSAGGPPDMDGAEEPIRPDGPPNMDIIQDPINRVGSTYTHEGKGSIAGEPNDLAGTEKLTGVGNITDIDQGKQTKRIIGPPDMDGEEEAPSNEELSDDESGNSNVIPEKEISYDLSKEEDRKNLANKLIENKGRIIKISIQVD